MKLNKKTTQQGFSVLEFIIVFVFIGMLTALVVVAMDSSRVSGRNAARITQINEYRKAFELYYSDHGHYPVARAGEDIVEEKVMCLGDYSDDKCWIDGTSVSESSEMIDALTPEYMRMIPYGSNQLFAEGNEHLYTGMIYFYQNFGDVYSVKYFMEGLNQDCKLPKTGTGVKLGQDTLCTYIFTP